LGWDSLYPGDQTHGPLGNGFDSFFGLPLTLVEGFDLDLPFLTYTRFSGDDHPLHKHANAALLSLLVVFAVYSRDFGYSLLVAAIAIFFLVWFFVEHFSLHTDKWWRRSLYMEKFLNSQLMDDTKVYEQPVDLERLTDRLTNRALKIIEESAEGDKPFAIYMSYPNVHTPLVSNPRFKGESEHGPYGER